MFTSTEEKEAAFNQEFMNPVLQPCSQVSYYLSQWLWQSISFYFGLSFSNIEFGGRAAVSQKVRRGASLALEPFGDGTMVVILLLLVFAVVRPSYTQCHSSTSSDLLPEVSSTHRAV